MLYANPFVYQIKERTICRIAYCMYLVFNNKLPKSNILYNYLKARSYDF